MKSLWKILSRKFLGQLIQEWFASDGPKLEKIVMQIGVDQAIAREIVGKMEAWLLQKASHL